jgi:CRISPR-associated protein Csd1
VILAALEAYYRRLLDKPDSGVAAPGYSSEKISFAIELATDGIVVDVIDLRDHSGKKPLPASLDVPQPEKRTVKISSNFLWDKTSYALGVSAVSKRSEQEHAAFTRLHVETLADTDDDGIKALLAFLQSWTPASFDGHPAFSRHPDIVDANVVFRFEGERQLLHQRPAARSVWTRLSAGGSGAPEHEQACLVTGDRAPIARLHPAIKGVNGAQSSGASIVSFNLDAFSSYGKTQGENAPVSEQSAFAYTTALNYLLRRDPHNRQRLQIGDATVVFWAQASDEAMAAAAEDVFAAAFLDPRDEDDRATSRLREVLDQVRQLRPLRDLGGHLDDGTHLFVLGLAPNASRLSIRFWETGSLATFARRLADHYDDLELQPAAWRRPPTPHALALATAPIYDGRAKSEDVSPLLAGELSRAVLSGSRYPRSVLSAIVMRLRADGKLTDLRAALCKGVLARDARLGSKDTNKRITPVSLDTGNTDPGYLLGRLFSTLENVQRAALGANVNATIRDRYYGAASATPASVFPVLLRTAQSHLSRVRKDKPGFAVLLEKEIGQIVDLLDPTLPRSLPMEAQGRFAIGYYHQTKARFVRSDDQDAITESEGEAAV